MNKDYIAAAFDGEGSLVPSKQGNHLNWQLSIYNNDLDWLHLLQQYLNNRGYHFKVVTDKRNIGMPSRVDYRIAIWRLPEINRFLDEFPSLMPKRSEKIAEFTAYNKRRPGSGGDRTGASALKAYRTMEQHSRRMM